MHHTTHTDTNTGNTTTAQHTDTITNNTNELYADNDDAFNGDSDDNAYTLRSLIVLNILTVMLTLIILSI